MLRPHGERRADLALVFISVVDRLDAALGVVDRQLGDMRRIPSAPSPLRMVRRRS